MNDTFQKFIMFSSSLLIIFLGYILVSFFLIKKEDCNKKMVDLINRVKKELRIFLSDRFSISFSFMASALVLILYFLDNSTLVGFIIGTFFAITQIFIGKNILLGSLDEVAILSNRKAFDSKKLKKLSKLTQILFATGSSLLIATFFHFIYRSLEMIFGFGLAGLLFAIIFKFRAKTDKGEFLELVDYSSVASALTSVIIITCHYFLPRFEYSIWLFVTIFVFTFLIGFVWHKLISLISLPFKKIAKLLGRINVPSLKLRLPKIKKPKFNFKFRKNA